MSVSCKREKIKANELRNKLSECRFNEEDRRTCLRIHKLHGLKKKLEKFAEVSSST